MKTFIICLAMLAFCKGYPHSLDSIVISGIVKGVNPQSRIRLYSFLEGRSVAEASLVNEQFKIKSVLPTGIYRLLFKKGTKDVYLDVFVSGKEPEIAFEFDPDTNADIPAFSLSEENRAWYAYKLNSNKLFSKSALLEQFLLYYNDNDDLRQLSQSKLEKTRATYDSINQGFIKRYNGSLLGKTVANLPKWSPKNPLADKTAQNLEHLEGYWEQPIDTKDTDLLNTPVYITHINTYLGLFMKVYSVDEIASAMPKGIDILMQQLGSKPEIKKQAANAILEVIDRPGLDEVLKYLDQTYLDTSMLSNDKLKSYANRLASYRKFIKGQAVPDVSFEVNQKKLSLKDLVGKKVVLAFWSSDCNHCKEDMPKLNALAKARKDLSVLAICVGNSKASYNSFVAKLDAMYHRCDFDYNSKPVEDYYIRSTPEFFVLDSSLHFVEKFTSYETLLNSKKL